MNDTVTAPAAAETDPHLVQAAALKAEADEIRETARAAVTDAERHLAEARAEADRLVREAQNAHNAAVSAALTADRHAQDVEGVAGYHRAASSTARQIADIQATIADLDDEHADLTSRLDGLGARLAQVAVDQQAARVGVDTALDQDDAEAVAAHRARLAALDEITGGLTVKAAAIRTRLAAIGDRSHVGGTALLPTALRSLEAARAGQDAVLDALDPTRPGAEARAAVKRMGELLEYAAKHPVKTPPPVTSHVQGSANGGRTAVVRRNG